MGRYIPPLGDIDGGARNTETAELPQSLSLVDQFTGRPGQITIRYYDDEYAMITIESDGNFKGDMQIEVFDPGRAISANDFIL